MDETVELRTPKPARASSWTSVTAAPMDRETPSVAPDRAVSAIPSMHEREVRELAQAATADNPVEAVFTTPAAAAMGPVTATHSGHSAVAVSAAASIVPDTA